MEEGNSRLGNIGSTLRVDWGLGTLRAARKRYANLANRKV